MRDLPLFPMLYLIYAHTQITPLLPPFSLATYLEAKMVKKDNTTRLDVPAAHREALRVLKLLRLGRHDHQRNRKVVQHHVCAVVFLNAVRKQRHLMGIKGSLTK